MSENNDKSQTLEFKPVKEEKVRVERSNDDVFSNPRKNDNYREQKRGNDKKLVITAIILALLLVVAIIAAAVIISSDKREIEDVSPIEMEEIIPDEEEEMEENLILVYDIVFYGDSVIKKDGKYTVFADLYNKSFEKEDNRKLVISDETDIRENGKRITAEGLVYLIENMTGEQIVFEGEIRDKDNVLLSVSFDGSFREELNEESAEEIIEETPENESDIPEEEISEELPPETVENTDTEAVTIN